jgi:hypothetical protein
MKHNLTLAVEAEVLDRVRVLAARRRSSVSELVRGYLEALAAADEAQTLAAARLKAALQDCPLAVGEARWQREELHGC